MTLKFWYSRLLDGIKATKVHPAWCIFKIAVQKTAVSTQILGQFCVIKINILTLRRAPKL